MSETTAEVVVIGAGIVGAAVARELAVRGVDTLVLDRAGVARGTTGLGEGNVIVADKRPGPELDLALHGRALYDELERRLGAAISLRRKGCLVVHEAGDALRAASAGLDALRAAGVDAEVVDGDGLREMEPALARDLAGAIFYPGDMQVDATAVATGLAREADAAGARMSLGRPVARIVVERDRVVGVETDRGEIRSAAVVLAAGTWSAELAATAGLTLPVEPRKGQLALTERVAEPVRHKVIDGSYASSVESGAAGLLVSTVLESSRDGRMLVGSSRERRGFDTEPEDRVTEAILNRARRFLPSLPTLRIERTWAGLRPFLPDHLPAIGPSRLVEGLWVATGHEGAGIGLGPITGRVVAQAYSGEPTPIELAPFDPDRFASSGV